MRKWESVGAATYYYLGASYYFYQWLIILGIAAQVVGALLLRGKLLFFLAVSFFAAASFTGGVVAWLIRTRKRLHFLNPDLSIDKQIDTYTVGDSNHYTFEKNITIRALRSGVDSHKTKLKWTGTGPINISLNPPTVGYTSVSKSDVWDLARVHLSRPLNRDETESFTLKLEMTDDKATALPFSQSSIDDFYPNGLTMRVVLPTPPSKITKEIFLSPRSELHISREEEQPLRGQTEISWPIKRPQIGRRYKLSWIP